MKDMKRVEAEIKARGETLAAFATRIGVSSQHINNWKKRGIPRSKQRIVANDLGWTLDKLLTGFDNSEEVSNTYPMEKLNSAYSEEKGIGEEPLNSEIWWPSRSIDMDGDRIVLMALQHSPIAFTREWLDAKGLEENMIATFRSPDESMQPWIRLGDWVLVNLEDREVQDAGFFITVLSGTLNIRRIFFTYSGNWILRAGNPEEYPDQQVPPEDQGTRLQIVGRVLWHGGCVL